MSQDKAAQALGLKRRQTLSSWESPRNSTIPAHVYLHRMAILYDRSVAYLLGMKDENVRPIWPTEAERRLFDYLRNKGPQAADELLKVLKLSDDVLDRERTK